GDYDAAAESLSRAIRIRQRMLGLSGTEFPSRKALEAALRNFSAVTDTDGDWLTDAVEVALGLDPTRTDSDGDGVADGEELLGPNSWPAALAWGVNGEVGHLIAFTATAHPTAFGFHRHMSIDREEWRSANDYTSLVMATGTMGAYIHPVPRVTAEV